MYYKCFYPAALYPMKREPNFIVHSQDLASNPGFKCWLPFHYFLRLWENNLTPIAPVLSMTNPAQTLWSIKMQLMNSFGACKLTWYYFLLIHWDCKKFTKQSPVSSQEQGLSKHSHSLSSTQQPFPCLWEGLEPSRQHVALAAPSPRYKFGQTRSWSQLQLTLAWKRLLSWSNIVVSISPLYIVRLKLLCFILWMTMICVI